MKQGKANFQRNPIKQGENCLRIKMMNLGKISSRMLTLGLCLLILFLPAVGIMEALPADAPLYEPVVSPDAALSTGLVTEWCCVTFGSYPQTEIAAAVPDSVDAFAMREGDFQVDPELYARLADASWAEDETEIDGIRYLRINRRNAAGGTANSAGHYRWGLEEYHYFRYDPIRWRILDLEDGRALLMADRLLDCQPYHAGDGPVTWESSTIRSWLNGLPETENSAGIDYRAKGFLDKAFSDSQREAILPTAVKNSPNSNYHTDCGEDTVDRVFLLSNDEVYEPKAAATHGFYPGSGKDDPARRFRSTQYAKCRGAWWSSVNGYRGNSFWFMRTNGYTPESVSYICDFGYIYQRGTMATCGDAGILPALWIQLDAADEELAGWVTSRDIEEGALLEHSVISSKEQLSNPVVEMDPEEPDGKRVTYSLVSFGAYPQTEIVKNASENAGNRIVDPLLYAALEIADWTDDEWENGGRRYSRLRIPENESSPGSFRYFVQEPILWRVLEIRDGTALLMADAALDCQPFHADSMDVSWENCTLRSWLNGYGPESNRSTADYSAQTDNFLDRAFTSDEQAAILEYPVRNENNYYFGMDSGNNTVDRIFLLAESELFMHDSSEIHGFSPRDEVRDRAKQFAPTDYALARGAWAASDGPVKGNVFWITRTTGYTHANVVYVDENGCMYNRGILCSCSDTAIIPALMLDLNFSAYTFAGTVTIGK